jgi:uncharacterized protein
MLRKFIRKVLPSHDSMRNNRYVARLGPRLHHHNLWHLNRRSVAGGVAAGMFAGLIPGSNPVQFTAGAVLAVTLHVNLPVAVLVTLYSNPFTIVPLYYVAFRLGQLAMLQGDSGLPALPEGFGGLALFEKLPEAFNWLIGVGKPLIVGLPLLAILLAVSSYLLVNWIWRLSVCWQWRRRHRQREKR